jgi:hypothetical protein
LQDQLSHADFTQEADIFSFPQGPIPQDANNLCSLLSS